MQQKIEDIFKGYLSEISETMTNEKSTYTRQTKVIEEQFLRYGLTNQQLAVIVSEINGKAMQFITQYSNASALELVKLNENRPLLAAQISLAEKELELKEKDLQLKDKDLELKDKDIALKGKELEIKQEELEIKQQQVLIQKEELKIKQKELELKEKQLLEMTAKIALMNAQTVSEGFKQKQMFAATAASNAQTKNLGAEYNIIVEKKLTQVQETAVKKAQVGEVSAKECLIRKQCETESKQQSLLGSQSSLVERQETGYDDNRRVKKAEMSSNMAGFAVNASADNAGTMVNNANGHINNI